jgi:N-acetylglucosamine malate deacetylase 2
MLTPLESSGNLNAKVNIRRERVPDSIEQLLRSTLILVAHPDDESIGCGILLQRISQAAVVLCTDGGYAGVRPWYIEAVRTVLGSRKRYTRKRLAEFRGALNIAGVQRVWMASGVPDQQLHLSLGRAAALIEHCVREHRPEAILSHAFESGHPDHDACAVLARWAGLKFSLPVWEMPLYYRPGPSSDLVYQQFLDRGNSGRDNEVVLHPNASELSRKEKMLAQHQSQTAVISEFQSAREVFRPQPSYDFRVNPNPALSSYAVCGHIAIESVLESFRSFLDAGELSTACNALTLNQPN